MKKPDLSLFDNADKQTVERLAADYRALDGREQEKLCGRLLERCGAAELRDGEAQVSGVEQYRRPKWKIAASIVSAAAMLFFGTAAALHVLRGQDKNISPADNVNTETVTVTSAAEEVTSENVTEASSEALQKHGKDLKEYDMSTQKGVYFKMLNCIDYYDRASGKLTESDNKFGTVNEVEFQTDLISGRSYSHVVISLLEESAEGDTISNFLEYSDGENIHTYDFITKKHDYPYGYGTGSVKKRAEEVFDIPDSERHIIDEAKTDHWAYRQDSTNVRYAHDCLCNQEMIFGFLSDLDGWHIEGTEDYIGRECVVIKGSLGGDYGEKLGVSDFEFYVDSATGTILKYIGNNSSGECTSYMTVHEIAFDDEAKKVRAILYIDKDMTSVAESGKLKYSTNENGQTYGKDSDAAYPEDMPELIAVIGDNGNEGYVYKSELFDDGIRNPEEALEYEKAKREGRYEPKVLKVYEADGKTVIDTFTESVN
ncbi:hypothetical protein [Ruminococcus flavefaciens]|uniref:Uncharacterized protein n=1 Tax=Ruminococcus flavefaciens 007c TaxID=1341157 RepID=W7UBS5_RUMFL|nr:hypothetical protein [Ruminococcus flavefaciens]EWM52556.1 hypothetical protein RF007C_08440 [Ruminococcus flavefaciens 007c]